MKRFEKLLRAVAGVLLLGTAGACGTMSTHEPPASSGPEPPPIPPKKSASSGD